MEDYKQKYEEALERAKNYHKGHKLDVNPQSAMEYVFPELRESEDESIRKEIIQSIQDNMCVIHKDKCIAWLEKQGEQNHKEKVDEAMREIDEKARAFSDKHKGESSDDILAQMIGIQKPADGIKPKFKAGDWVVWNGHIICYIDNIYPEENTLMYTINTNGVTWVDRVKEFDAIAHLWTIQDAKDGDVLANENGSPFIFNGFLGKTTVGTHCGITSGIFCIPREKTIWASRNVLPATKEQCDLLFSKMKEAGYEWDAEKKELKKIEPKFKVGDTIRPKGSTAEYTIESIYGGCYHGKGWGLFIDGDEDYELVEHKPAWSEEECQIIKDAACFILSCVNTVETKEEKERLDKLADKLQNLRPQLKQEWSEEDEDYRLDVNAAVDNYFDEGYAEELRGWLKSLKERMKGE